MIIYCLLPRDEGNRAKFSNVVLLLLLSLLLLLGGDRRFTALQVRQCPLVLLVKVGWRQGTDLGNKGDCWVYIA
jgi:hypothetical protein